MTSRLPAHLSAAPEPRRRLDPEVHADHQRRRIIAAATEVFAACGFAATSVEDILAAAHVGAGSFYALFASKEDCFLRCYEAGVAAGRERLAAVIPSAAPWEAQALAALRQLVELIAAEPALARLVVLEAQTAGEEARALHERTLASLPPLLARGRGTGRAGAELPESHEIATVGGIAWLLQERLGAPQPAVEELLPELVEIVVAPYLGEAAAAGLLGQSRPLA